ncbi:MAG: aminoglycoside phosphotransferase family protein [Clostridiales bacterium]|nr:aminoglycoside phosphotransferase family protein [Clostridiales bacterium]
MDIRTIQTLKEVSDQYILPGSLKAFTQCVNGHINDTYRVLLRIDNATEKEYIFQRINDYVFKEPIKVMRNIKEISKHTRPKITEDTCDIITFLDNKAGKNYTIVNGDYWRVCYFVKNSVAFDYVEDSKVLYSAGYAFGRFQELLSDLPMDKLYVTIPDFHNTKKRLNSFFEMVSLDPLGRVKDVKEEIAFFEEQRELASSLVELQETGKLPLRVTHNDTKYNNILMDKDSLEPLCVIDLDTVMPGLAAYDFGDAIRFAANTAVEDEPDLSKVSLNMENYEEFTRGYMTACQGSLTQKEVDTMALGAIVITIELASRFLLDHLNGDKYFRLHRPNHNLDRARCQIKLAQDMLEKLDVMNEIVKKYA